MLGSLDDGDDDVSPSDETTIVLGGQSRLPSHAIRQQQQRRSSESEEQDDEEGCAVYDEDDDEEAHPWRNEHGRLPERRLRQSASSKKQAAVDDDDEEDGHQGDDTITSLTLHSPQEQQQHLEQSLPYGRETREGSSWTAVTKDNDDDHDDDAGGGKQ